MQDLTTKNLTQTIMSQMAAIEVSAKKMFSEIDAAFEAEIFQAIDSKRQGSS